MRLSKAPSPGLALVLMGLLLGGLLALGASWLIRSSGPAEKEPSPPQLALSPPTETPRHAPGATPKPFALTEQAPLEVAPFDADAVPRDETRVDAERVRSSSREVLILGTVRGPEGAPLADALVNAHLQAAGRRSPKLPALGTPAFDAAQSFGTTIRSGPDGAYRLTLRAWRARKGLQLRIQAHHPDGAVSRAAHHELRFGALVEQDLQIRPATKLEVLVTSGGTP